MPTENKDKSCSRKNDYTINDAFLPDKVNACVRCGRCKEVCPSYRATSDESKVARGRLMVLSSMLSGKLKPSAGVREILDACLKCHQCASICPRGIDTVDLFLRGRAKIKGASVRSVLTRLVLRIMLPRRWLYNLAMKTAKWVQKILPVKKGGLRHLPLFFEGKRNLPDISSSSALSKLPEKTGTGTRVLFYTGCLINYIYPGTAANAVKLMENAGCEVIIPKKQLCCGLASLYLGDRKTAGKLALKNTGLFSSYDAEYVVTACATCATMLKNEYPKLLETEWPGEIKVMELSEFLVSRGFVPKGREEPVTYHDPCHMRYAQGICEEPRKLISAVAELREFSEPGRCCGGGGTFSLFHYDLSLKIGEKKNELIEELQTGTVVTNCPGCMLQLSDVAGDGIKVRHMADFLTEAAERGNRGKQDGFVATMEVRGTS